MDVMLKAFTFTALAFLALGIASSVAVSARSLAGVEQPVAMVQNAN